MVGAEISRIFFLNWPAVNSGTVLIFFKKKNRINFRKFNIVRLV